MRMRNESQAKWVNLTENTDNLTEGFGWFNEINDRYEPGLLRILRFRTLPAQGLRVGDRLASYQALIVFAFFLLKHHVERVISMHDLHSLASSSIFWRTEKRRTAKSKWVGVVLWTQKFHYKWPTEKSGNLSLMSPSPLRFASLSLLPTLGTRVATNGEQPTTAVQKRAEERMQRRYSKRRKSDMHIYGWWAIIIIIFYTVTSREWRSWTGQRAATDDSVEAKREKKGIILARFKYGS